MIKSLSIILTCLCLAVPVYSDDANAILQKVDRNLNPEAFEMYRKLINVELDGSKKEFIMYSVKKGRDRIASVFLSPASEKGRATLRLGENMWLYIPNVGKPIRITSLQSVTGGIFNNADIMRLDYSAEYNCEKMERREDLRVLHLKAKTRSVAYDSLKMWVDDRKLLPAKIECFASSGMLIKTLYFKKIQDFGGGLVRPAVIETDSLLHKGYKSIMIFAKMKQRDLPDEAFTLNFLSRVESLR
jgi:outer membrane lipoprotein-sorting protein